jgi:hypothetical protein
LPWLTDILVWIFTLIPEAGIDRYELIASSLELTDCVV